MGLPGTGENDGSKGTVSVAGEGKTDILCTPVVGCGLPSAGSPKPHDSPAIEG